MCQFGGDGMKGRARLLGLVIAACALFSGCKTKTTVGITLSPTSATVLVGTTSQFTASVTNGGAVNWSVNGVANGNTTVGTISTSGLYTAPLSVPTTAGTPPTPTAISVTATLQSDSAVTASASVTVDSGVRVAITPTSFTLGTGETLQFSAAVSGVPLGASIVGVCNAISAPPSAVPYCNSVTWSVTPTSGAGNFPSPTSGTYVAPGTATTAVITATSIFDSSRIGTASVSIVQATAPTLTSISPTTAPRGGLFQDVYLTGTNLLSTTSVFVNGTQIPNTDVIVPQPGLTVPASSTVGTLMHVRLSDQALTTAPVPPATVATLTFSVEQQQGTTQVACSNPGSCTLSLNAVRPAIVGTSPDSIPQGTGAPVAFNVNGGFFGTTQTPAVTATFAGNEVKFPIVSSTNSTRQMTVTIGGGGNAGDVSTPGLFPVAISSNVNPAATAVANIAIQPSYPASTINPLVQFSGANAGSLPAAVAINSTTGLAVVANNGSNDVELIDLTKATPAVVGFICTASVASGSSLSLTESGACPAAGPVSVAIDNVSNLALVADAGISSIALVDLNLQKVSAVVAVPMNNNPTTPVPLVPSGIGVNPLNHRAIVAYQSTNAGSILDLTQSPASPQFFAGVVNISTGPNARVAVSPRLDWALVTPGGLGSLSIVDLARQTTSTIAPSATPGASRASGIVTITTTTAQNLQAGEPVMITGVADASFNGIYSVNTVPSSTSFTYLQPSLSSSNLTSGGGMISYALPVATLASSLTTQGVALNDQTQKAILTDPSGSTPGTVFSVLDQSSTNIPLPTNNMADASSNLAVAINPLANLAVTLNQVTGDALVIDPSAPSVLTTISAEGVNPVDAAIDPITDIAVFVNQGAPASISIYSLGALRMLQVLQASVSSVNQLAPCPPTQNPIFAGPTVLVCTLSPPVPQTLTIIGSGFTNNSKVRLDGQVLQTTLMSSRELLATVDVGFQTVARRYSLDVADSGVVSNSTSFTVAQSVNLPPGSGAMPSVRCHRRRGWPSIRN